jgi:hypothetical protein
MFINSTGNVGIGTTSPSTLFYVNGYTASNWITTLNNTGTSGHQMYFGYNDGSTTRYGLYIDGGPGGGAGNFDFAVGSSKFRILSGGNVGIGTTSPVVKLDIQSSSSGTGLGDGMLLKLKNTSTTTNTRSGINFGNIDGIGGSLAMQSAILKNASTGEYDMTWDLYGGSAGWKEGLLYLDSNPGNVGIGTTSPGAKLDVAGSIYLSETGVIQGRAYPYDTTLGAGADATTTIIDAGSTSGYRSRIKVAGGSATDPNTIILYTSSTEKMRITSGGDVLYQFSGNKRIGIDYDFTGAYFYGFATDNVARATRIICAAADANAGIQFQTGASFSAATTKMIVTSGGNVGIGTTSPNSTLQVRGDNGSSASAVLRIRDTNSTSRTTRLQFEDYNGTLADGLIDFKIGTAGNASTATLSIGVNSAGLTFNNSNTATFSSDITGKGAFNGYAGATHNLLIDWSAESQVTTLTNTNLFFGTNAQRRMTITSDGNVGIGTTSPSSLLHLNSSVAALRLSGGGYGASYNTTLSSIAGAIGILQLGNNADNYIIGGNTATGGYLVFKVNATAETYTSGTEAMRIASNGKIGINNSSPNNFFDIFSGGPGQSNSVAGFALRSQGGGTFITGRIVARETSNQTQTIATFNASNASNERIFVKVQVVNVSAVNDYGNVHVGYALWSKTGTKSTTTMTLDSGNSNIGNGNVGTLSWSGNDLQYTTNGAGNYELNSITIWGSARDTGVIS